jgi:hypothetical protein
MAQGVQKERTVPNETLESEAEECGGFNVILKVAIRGVAWHSMALGA